MMLRPVAARLFGMATVRESHGGHLYLVYISMMIPAKIRRSYLGLPVLLSALFVFQPVSAVAQTGKTTAAPQIASGSAMVVDLTNNAVLYESHPDRIRPVASISKVMTAMVVLDAHLPLDEKLRIDISQTPQMRGVYSRVRLESETSRKTLLMLALMSSENRAAATLAANYPGGYQAFIDAMNAKARALGMNNTHFVEPTGLSKENMSTARDLVKLIIASRQYPLISELSTIHESMAEFTHPNYILPFRNTNHLMWNKDWQIALTKTGYTSQAGHCLIMRTRIKQRPVALVVLDAFGKYTHFADAKRLRDWLENGRSAPVPAAALAYKKEKIREG